MWSGDFDGVSEAAYKSAWLLNEGPQTLTGSNSLANVDASAVNFQGIYVDGVHLGRLHTVTAKIDEQTTLNSTTFGEVLVLKLHSINIEYFLPLPLFQITSWQCMYIKFQTRSNPCLELPWMELSRGGIFMSKPCSLPQIIKG